MSKHFPAALLAAGLCVLLAGSSAWANNGCSTCGHQKVSCPPPHCHYAEGPPNLKFKKACPRPVCDPCNLEHYGYHATCWAPWAFGPNYSHCPIPHAGTVLPPPLLPPDVPRMPLPGPALQERPGGAAAELEPLPKRPGETLHPPRRFDDKPSVRLMPVRYEEKR